MVRRVRMDYGACSVCGRQGGIHLQLDGRSLCASCEVEAWDRLGWAEMDHALNWGLRTVLLALLASSFIATCYALDAN